jgi:subtilisin family serine protease
VLDISPKPDIVAPGESIVGPWLLGDKVSSGTSMSTPLIAGGTALVMANNKPLVDTAKILYYWNLGVIGDAFENALIDGCTYKGEPDAWGAGIPDFTKVNDNFRFNLLVLIFIPIVLIVSIISVSAVVLYKRRKGDGTSW